MTHQNIEVVWDRARISDNSYKTSVFYTQSNATVNITCNYVLEMRACTVADHLNKNGSDSEPLPVTQARIIYKSCVDTGE